MSGHESVDEPSADARETAAWFGPDAGGFVEPPPHEVGWWARVIAERLCPPLADALCRQRAHCGCEESSDSLDCRTVEQSECERWVDAHYRYFVADATLLETQLETCIDEAARSRDCRNVSTPSSCTDLLDQPSIDGLMEEEAHPGGSEGARCLDEDACRRGLACIEGRCVARCWSDDQCERTEACLDATCQRLLSVGEPCEQTEYCAISLACVERRCARATPCTQPVDDCGNHAMCVGTLDHECRPFATEDGCHSDDHCPLGMTCEDERCVTAPGPGSPCTGRCALGSFCEWSHGAYQRCVAFPVRAIGDACDGDYVNECGSRLVCGPDRRCIEPVPLGGNCELARCAPTARCVVVIRNGRCEWRMCTQPALFQTDSD